MFPTVSRTCTNLNCEIITATDDQIRAQSHTTHEIFVCPAPRLRLRCFS